MKTALGKGLTALMPPKSDEVIHLDIDRITANRQQPRKVFKDESLKDLSHSIKEKGVLQPVIVSRQGNGTFTLIAGERRWRASRLAGLRKIPAIIKDTTPEDALEIALIENIQREDLSPIETAIAFHTLMNEFHLTQEDLSLKVGKERATVANYLRLLRLPDEIKNLVNDEKLSMGHARAILSLEDKESQIEAARKIVQKGLSVREAEALIRHMSSMVVEKKKPIEKDPQISSLEENLIRSLGTKVRIRHKDSGKEKGRGVIEIEYYSLDEFQRLLEIFTK